MLAKVSNGAWQVENNQRQSNGSQKRSNTRAREAGDNTA